MRQRDVSCKKLTIALSHRRTGVFFHNNVIKLLASPFKTLLKGNYVQVFPDLLDFNSVLCEQPLIFSYFCLSSWFFRNSLFSMRYRSLRSSGGRERISRNFLTLRGSIPKKSVSASPSAPVCLNNL